ncbi:MAG TPA: TonB family protein [Vicinamibacterales bacterium]|nr:TonB family protein [Vicinamibacterales bacterium]
MTEAVTDVIVARSRPSERLKPMVVWSVAAHAVFIAAVVFTSVRAIQEQPREVMTISLGGAPGPRAGGMTQIGGRPIQALTPAKPPRLAEPAPAPKAPEMALPNPKAKPRVVPKPTQAPDQAPSRRLTTGDKIEDGSAKAYTGARGQGFGLSTGGGGGNGVRLDVGNFCCPDYLEQMRDLIQRNWQQNQGVAGSTVIRFTIARDGAIVMPQVEQSSGFQVLDLNALRAVQVTARLPALPAAYPNPTLGLHLTFEYQR